MATRSAAAAARLRRAFQYPTDDNTPDMDSGPRARVQVMDEQEQELFIKRLADTNSAKDAQVTLVLLALPVLASIPYVPSLPSLPAVVALSSLLSTAYLLRRLPPAVTGIRPLDVWGGAVAGAGAGGQAGAVVAGFFGGSSSSSHLDAALPYLNALLGLLLAFWGGAVAYKAHALAGDAMTPSSILSSPLAWPIMCNLPAGVYAAVLISKVLMASVDPERDLSGLRYEYRGA